jgi:hypothetical protein
MWYAFRFVSPLPRNLDSSLYCFCSCVHWQHHVESEQLGDECGESRENIIVEGAAAECQSRRLLGQCLNKFGVAMALVHGAVCREEVEVVFAFGIPYRTAARSGKDCPGLAGRGHAGARLRHTNW